MQETKQKEIREKFAEIEHTRWAKWQKYLHSVCTVELKDGTFEETGRLIIEADKVKHWERQINTPYSELSEKEKDSDREQVEPYLKEFNTLLAEDRAKILSTLKEKQSKGYELQTCIESLEAENNLLDKK